MARQRQARERVMRGGKGLVLALAALWLTGCAASALERDYGRSVANNMAQTVLNRQAGQDLATNLREHRVGDQGVHHPRAPLHAGPRGRVTRRFPSHPAKCPEGPVRIVRRGGTVLLRDLESKNGTLLGEFFADAGFELCEGYGLTETSPAACRPIWCCWSLL